MWLPPLILFQPRSLQTRLLTFDLPHRLLFGPRPFDPLLPIRLFTAPPFPFGLPLRLFLMHPLRFGRPLPFAPSFQVRRRFRFALPLLLFRRDLLFRFVPLRPLLFALPRRSFPARLLPFTPPLPLLFVLRHPLRFMLPDLQQFMLPDPRRFIPRRLQFVIINGPIRIPTHPFIHPRLLPLLLDSVVAGIADPGPGKKACSVRDQRYRLQLARRPGEGPSPEHVNMQMRHALAGIWPAIDHNAVA